MKKTSNETQPHNIESGITQKPLIGSFSNLKNSILLEMKKTSNGRRHQNNKSGISQQPLIETA